MGRTWLFQANPKRYRILESLRVERAEYWNLNQHKADVGVGDRVLIWVCGDDPGIYAVGTVESDPVVMPDSPEGRGYWLVPGEGEQAKLRARVRYDQLLLDRPLRKAFLQSDPALCDLAILHFWRGTNFPVSEAEWQSLQDWLS